MIDTIIQCTGTHNQRDNIEVPVHVTDINIMGCSVNDNQAELYSNSTAEKMIGTDAHDHGINNTVDYQVKEAMPSHSAKTRRVGNAISRVVCKCLRGGERFSSGQIQCI